MIDYYKTLGLHHNATESEIKKAYRTAALFWHPDKNKSSNAHSRFIEISEAYNILIDPQKRGLYDKLSNFSRTKNIDPAQNNNEYDYQSREDYQLFMTWVNEARVRAKQMLLESIDDMLTDTFHFIDKYGWLLLLMFVLITLLFAISLS